MKIIEIIAVSIKSDWYASKFDEFQLLQNRVKISQKSTQNYSKSIKKRLKDQLEKHSEKIEKKEGNRAPKTAIFASKN